MPSSTPAPQRAPYVSIAQAADEYGVSTKTIRRRIADGSLTAHRLKNSRLIRIERSSLDELLGRPIAAGQAS